MGCRLIFALRSLASQIQYSTHTPRVRIAGMPLPAFHTLGIYIQLIYSLYGGMSIGLYPPTATSPSSLPVMPTPDNVLEHMQRTKSNGLITIPALLEIWAQSDEAVDLLKTLEFVVCSLSVLLLQFLMKCAKRRGIPEALLPRSLVIS